MNTNCVTRTALLYELAVVQAIPELFQELKKQLGTRDGVVAKCAQDRALLGAQFAPILQAKAAEEQACEQAGGDVAKCKKGVEGKYAPLLKPYNQKASAIDALANKTRDEYKRAESAALARFQALRDSAASVMAYNLPIACSDDAVPARRSVSSTPPHGIPSEITPDVVYLSQIGEPGFIAQAKAFHDQWMLPSMEIMSLEEIIDDIPTRAAKASFSRLRIVTHATSHDLRLSVFKKGELVFQRQLIQALADSDISLLRTLLFFEDFDLVVTKGGWNILFEQQQLDVHDNVRDALIQASAFPSGLRQEDEELVRVYFFALVLSQSITMKQSLTQYDGTIASYVFALTTLISLLRAEFAGSVSARILQPMEDRVRKLVKGGKVGLKFELPPHEKLPKDNGDANHSVECRAAADAVRAGLRKRIDRMRRALRSADGPVWVDIRGCNAGKDVNQAIRPLASLFDLSPRRISAPDAFQFFAPTSPAKRSFDCEKAEFETTAQREPVRRAVRRWASLLAVDESGFDWYSPKMETWFALDGTSKLRVLLNLTNVLPTFGTKADLVASGASAATVAAFPDTAIALFVILGYEDCLKEDVRRGREIWVRTMWADADKNLVKRLARDWDRNKIALLCPVLSDESRGLAIHGDPDYQRHIVCDDSPPPREWRAPGSSR